MGALPTGAFWQFAYTQPVSEIQLHTSRKNLNANPVSTTWDGGAVDQVDQDFPAAVQEQGDIRLTVTLFQDSGGVVVLDQGSGTFKFNGTGGLAGLIKQQGQGGFTENDRAQQQLIFDATVPTISVDTTVPITKPPSPPGGVTSAQLPLPIFGLIIRITSVPSDIVSTTPDGDYFFPSLAVATIFRDTDVWLRVPVHTPSKVIPLFGENIQAAVANALALHWIAAMTYQVSFRDGVSGTVTEMHFP